MAGTALLRLVYPREVAEDRGDASAGEAGRIGFFVVMARIIA